MAEPKIVLIKYIGKKDFFPDFVSQSGKSWNGYGDVQEVTEAQAKKLLVHDDEFAEKSAHDALLAAQPAPDVQAVTEAQAAEVTPATPVVVPVGAPIASDLPTAEEIAAMNKTDLVALAAAHAIEINDAAPVVVLRKQLATVLYPTV